MSTQRINATRIIMVTMVLAFGFTALGVLFPAKSNAVSASDWHAGRIIDDSIFFNKDAMSVAQIQAFLNAKVPVCDRNRQTYFNYAGKPYGPPFTCLKEYQENPTTKENNIARFNADGSPYNVPGGQSAAQIIWNAAQAYGINPQSLIVNLQKETGLITDTWAAGWQYDRAMGYGCPDSGPGGTANCNANYYGFYNQVVDAAYQFRNYVNNPQYFNFRAGVTRNILWNVSGCGSAPVYIENAATAALYNYTPYQPNQAALNNMYGTGDGCSAYGNRNFWRYFNEWFGSTLDGRLTIAHPDGTLVRPIDSQTVYILKDGQAIAIPSMGVFRSNGYDFDRVKLATKDDLAIIATYESEANHGYVQYCEGSVIKGSDQTIYITQIANGTIVKRPFASWDSFTKQGYNMSDVINVQNSELPPQTGDNVTTSAQTHLNNVLIREANKQTVYLLINNERHAISSLQVFTSQRYDFSHVKIALPGDMQLSESGMLEWYGEGALVKGSSPTVYVVDLNSIGADPGKRVFPTYWSFVGLGYKFSEVLTIPDSTLPSVDRSAIGQ